MREIWVVEVYTENMRPSAFDRTPEWTIAKVCESKRLADAWREDQEEIESSDRNSRYSSGHRSEYRTVRYTPEVISGEEP